MQDQEMTPEQMRHAGVARTLDRLMSLSGDYSKVAASFPHNSDEYGINLFAATLTMQLAQIVRSMQAQSLF